VVPGYAAFALQAGSVGTRELKDGAVTTPKLHKNAVATSKLQSGSVTSGKVKDHTLLRRDIKAGQFPILAYAHVNADGTVDEAHSSAGITDTNVLLDSTSAYCFSGLPFSFKAASVTVDYADAGVEDVVGQIAAGEPFDDCDGTDVQAEVATSVSGAFAPTSFYVVFF
jgi:hypothetical protein